MGAWHENDNWVNLKLAVTPEPFVYLSAYVDNLYYWKTTDTIMKAPYGLEYLNMAQYPEQSNFQATTRWP